MTGPTQTPSPRASWSEALDPELLRRLLSRAERPGLVPRSLSRRIVAGVEAMGGHLPLLGYLARRHGLHEGFQKGMVPVVHAVWTTPEMAGTEPAREPPRVQAMASRAPVERGDGALAPRPPDSTPLVTQHAPTPARASEASTSPREHEEGTGSTATALGPEPSTPRPVVRPHGAGTTAPRDLPLLQERPTSPSQTPGTHAGAPAQTVPAAGARAPTTGTDAANPAGQRSTPYLTQARPVTGTDVVNLAGPRSTSHPTQARPATGTAAARPVVHGRQSTPPLAQELSPAEALGTRSAPPLPQVRPSTGADAANKTPPLAHPVRPVATRSEPPPRRPRVSPTGNSGAGWSGTGASLVHAGGSPGGGPVGPGHAFPGAPNPMSPPMRRGSSPGTLPPPIVPGAASHGAPPSVTPPRPMASAPRPEPDDRRAARREVDIDELVDKVQRKLVRQLADERIRRGQPR